MVTDAEERAAIADQARFQELGDQLQDSVRARSVNYWQDRMVSTTVDAEFLAISWSGDLEYKMARTFDKAVKRVRKTQSEFGFGADRTKRDVARQMRASYRTRQDRRYAEEYYIFYKASELVPETLGKIAPTLVPAFHGAALHHFFVISRHQQVAERDETVSYTAWSVLDPALRTARELIDEFVERMFPKKMPEGGGGGDCDWCLPAILLLAATIITLVAGGLWWYGQSASAQSVEDVEAGPPALSDAVVSVPPAGEADDRIDGLESRVERLDLSVADLGNRISDLAERITQGTPTGPDMRASSELVAGSNAVAESLPGMMETHGLDLPPCLPVRVVDGRRIPAYLFIAVLGDAGIATLPREDPAQDLSAYQSALPFLGQTVDAGTFRRGSRAIADQARAAGCRHYVLLMEGDPVDASAYIAMRQAVEDNFYIYRLGREQ